MMTKPYPMELRQCAVRFGDAGESRHAVDERLGVSASCVIKWLAGYRQTGSVKPGKMGGHAPRKIAGPHRKWVLGQIANGGDVTHQGLADGLAARSCLSTSGRPCHYQQHHTRRIQRGSLFHLHNGHS